MLYWPIPEVEARKSNGIIRSGLGEVDDIVNAAGFPGLGAGKVDHRPAVHRGRRT